MVGYEEVRRAQPCTGGSICYEYYEGKREGKRGVMYVGGGGEQVS